MTTADIQAEINRYSLKLRSSEPGTPEYTHYESMIEEMEAAIKQLPKAVSLTYAQESTCTSCE